MQTPDSFEAVYYPQQVPRPASLPLLAFVFDKIYFPGVYLPTIDFDEGGVRREIERILAVPMTRHVDDVQMLNCMAFACHARHLRDLCEFTGDPGHIGQLEEGARELMIVIEEMIFGPPPPGFTPTPSLGFCKGFGDDDIRAQVNAPASLAYPANAVVFAAHHELPLINDDPTMPVPGVPSSPKGSANVLAQVLALESVKLALPRLGVMTPEEIAEFRAETKDMVRPFRVRMLQLSRELNSAIDSTMSLAEVQREAKFLVDTNIYPELINLKKEIESPGKPWHRRAVDLGKDVPELITNFLTMRKDLALAKLFSRLSIALADLRDEKLDKDHKLDRSGLHYLLKIEKVKS